MAICFKVEKEPKLEITEIRRAGATRALLDEASSLQGRRNAVVHGGEEAEIEEAKAAFAIATAVFNEVLALVLQELGISIKKGGELVDSEA